MDAMRTRFEVVLPGVQTDRLRAAAEAALAEIRSVERTFSFFDQKSWVSKINRLAAHSPLRVPPDVFELLQICQSVHRDTHGAFDPCVATPTSCPDRTSATFDKVQLHSPSRTVHFHHPELELDLGGIAKGWAIDQAVAVLLEAGVTSALVHGGTSSVRSLGVPENECGWKIAIGEFASTWLASQALSVSHTFSDSEAQSNQSCHIIHPRSGHPISLQRQSAVLASSATLADAWSTALLVDASEPFTWKQIS
jgi:thiamine biosynthesis lipoprotein